MRSTRLRLTAFAAATLATLAFAKPSNVIAADEASHSITLGESSFSPSTLTVPSGVKIRLVVHNARKATAEFESYDLNREKVIAPGASASIYIGPLQPGSYTIFDDFHASTKGLIVAK